MSSLNLLDNFVIGFALFFEQERKYPLPDVLQHSINVLALEKVMDMPMTFTGLLRLMQAQTIKDWYPYELPHELDPEARLLEENGLSYEAVEYLDQFTEQTKTSLFGLQDYRALNIVTANRDFLLLKKRLEDAFLQNNQTAPFEYCRLRRFIIENPYTTLEALETQFIRSDCNVSVGDVAKLYVEARSRAASLRYPDKAGQIMYWYCKHCGPLVATESGLKSIKATACGQHCPRSQGGWKPVAPGKDVLVLREGIHLRTHLPGVPELALYDWLYEQYEAYARYMQEPVLWPDIDVYDIRIEFGDGEVWGVDFKDYKDPYQLATQLRGIGQRGDKLLRTFYVYPAYRENQRNHYAEIARKNSEASRKNAELLSDERFRELVKKKLKSIREGK